MLLSCLHPEGVLHRAVRIARNNKNAGASGHCAHHVRHLRLRRCVDVAERHGAVLHHEAHLCELVLRALAALGTRVREEDVGNLPPDQKGVEFCTGRKCVVVSSASMAQFANAAQLLGQTHRLRPGWRREGCTWYHPDR